MPRTEAARLIVVDDEADIRAMIAEYLGRYGYEVLRCAGGAELDLMLATGPADLIVLDVSMPGEDGLSIARRLRTVSVTPIIMLTAFDDVVDRVVGLEIGADDYMTKPFDLRELRARIRAVLRRGDRVDPPSGSNSEEKISLNLVSFGKVSLDLDGYRLLDRDGAAQRLTSTEFDLLAAFAKNPNRVLSRDRLLDMAGGKEMDPFDRSIDIRVARVRKKIEIDASKPQIIRTIRGAGYLFSPPQGG